MEPDTAKKTVYVGIQTRDRHNWSALHHLDNGGEAVSPEKVFYAETIFRNV